MKSNPEEKIKIIGISDKVKNISNQYLKEISELIPESKVELIGAMAVPMKGKEEIDILVKTEDVDFATKVLVKNKYNKGPKINNISYLSDYRKEIEAGIQIMNPNHKMVKVHEKFINFMRENSDLKSKYENLKQQYEGKTVGEAMQEPTALYLKEANIIGDAFDSLDIYGINITGNGLHNFNRVGKNVIFNITDPMDPLPIHNLLMQESRWDVKTAFTKQNMGMGFAYIVRSQDRAELLTKIINNEGKNKAKIVGVVGVDQTGDAPLTILHRNAYDNKVHQFAGYNG